MVKQLFKGVVTQNFSEQSVNAVCEEAYLISGVVGNTLTLGDKTS
ncbi:hypothetical protein [Ruminococcus sp.]